MKSLWDVIIADDLDPQLLARCCVFLNEHFQSAFGRELTPAHFKWKLGSTNPAGAGFLSLAMHGEEVVGMLTGTRKRLWFGGRDVRACELGDGFTHPRFRRHGQARIPHDSISDPDGYLNKSIFGRLGAETTTRMLTAGCEFIYGTPNHLARPGWITKNGYVELTHQLTRSAHLPIRPSRIDRIPLRGHVSYQVHSIARGLTKPSLAKNLQRRRVRLHDTQPSREEMDNLWARAQPEAAARATLLKDGTYFLHRYVSVPDCSYQWISITAKDLLVGVVVTRRVTRSTGIKTIAIADWLFPPRFADLLPSVVQQIADAADDLDSVSLWMTQGSPGVERLRAAGFLRWRRCPVIAYPTSFTSDLVRQRAPFDITLGSTDNV